MLRAIVAFCATSLLSFATLTADVVDLAGHRSRDGLVIVAVNL